MATHNYLFADLVGSLAGVCLLAFFLLLPGFALAWWTDVFDFRRRTFAFQIAASVPLGIAICPAVTYFAARFGSMAAVWAIYLAAAIYGVHAILKGNLSVGRQWHAFGWIAAAWAAIAILSLVDLQIGERAWYPAAAFDYSLRTGFIQAIGRDGIPPWNPFYLPHQPAPLRYHYFWLLICWLANQAGGSLVGARHAWIAGTVWAGFGLMAMVALYFRLFWYRGPESFRGRALGGILLLGVTGLDILPTAVLWVLQAMGMPAVRPSLEWWNEQVDGFVYTALWEAHYLAALIACLMAFLILWSAPRRKASVALAGVALASAAGGGMYVAAVFGLFLAAWTAVLLARKNRREAGAVAAAGFFGLILWLPFALSLRGPALGGPAMEWWIRRFSPVEALLTGGGVSPAWIHALANALSLPLNYFLELGFFFAAAGIWWKRRHGKWSDAERATVLMIAVSVVVCTFLRSSVIGNNDLGWRGFLPAQFALLLPAVDVTGERGRRRFLTALLILGALGSGYEVAINRFYAPLADGGIVPVFSWLGPDRRTGERNYAWRAAGEWLETNAPPAAIVQYNPHVPAQNTSAALYLNQQTLAGSETCLSAFGGDPAGCPALLARFDAIYPPAGQPAAHDLRGVCRALPVNWIAAADTDPVWKDPTSWVWRTRPLYFNRYVRIFRCR